MRDLYYCDKEVKQEGAEMHGKAFGFRTYTRFMPIVLGLLAAILACNIPVREYPLPDSGVGEPENIGGAPATPAETPVESAGPSNRSFIPLGANRAVVSFMELSFLHDGNVWSWDLVHGTSLQRTWTGEVVSFAWSPDGVHLATFDGKSVCRTNVNNQADAACYELKISKPQKELVTHLTWTPDQRHLLIWNIAHPKPDIEVGWFIISVDDTSDIELLPGKAGNILYLPDGSLAGTLIETCNSGACTPELFRYDRHTHAIQHISLGDFSKTSELGILEGPDEHHLLSNATALRTGCIDYSSGYDFLTLDPRFQSGIMQVQDRQHDFWLSPDGSKMVSGRGIGCSNEIQQDWVSRCWPHDQPETLRFWDWQTDKQAEAVPGLTPQWSPDGNRIAFRSCLARRPDGVWVGVPTEKPHIFVIDSNGRNDSILAIMPGAFPQWRPKSLGP